jgi:hypothetical protein
MFCIEGLRVVAVVVVDILEVVSDVREGNKQQGESFKQPRRRRLTRSRRLLGGRKKYSRKMQTTYLGRHVDVLKGGAKAWLFSS